MTRLPYERGPAPLKITRPSLTATIGSPGRPAIAIPMLRGCAKSCTTSPEPGQIPSRADHAPVAAAPPAGAGAPAPAGAAAASGAARATGGTGVVAAVWRAAARLCARATSEYGCFSAFGSVFSRLADAAPVAPAAPAGGAPAPGSGRVSTGPRAIGVVCTPASAGSPAVPGAPPCADGGTGAGSAGGG